MITHELSAGAHVVVINRWRERCAFYAHRLGARARRHGALARVVAPTPCERSRPDRPVT
jgi:hypothetical protein